MVKQIFESKKYFLSRTRTWSTTQAKWSTSLSTLPTSARSWTGEGSKQSARHLTFLIPTFTHAVPSTSSSTASPPRDSAPASKILSEPVVGGESGLSRDNHRQHQRSQKFETLVCYRIGDHRNLRHRCVITLHWRSQKSKKWVCYNIGDHRNLKHKCVSFSEQGLKKFA